jgi:uncharacterized membrane protein (UPF0127 family)
MEVIVNNNLFNVKVMMTRKDIESGMMGKKFNREFNGMLFIMEDKKHSFWMKNCIIPLDIIFIKNNKITKIHRDCQPCKSEDCDRYEGNGDMVLEIRGGECDKYDIVVGDTILID